MANGLRGRGLRFVDRELHGYSPHELVLDSNRKGLVRQSELSANNFAWIAELFPQHERQNLYALLGGSMLGSFLFLGIYLYVLFSHHNTGGSSARTWQGLAVLIVTRCLCGVSVAMVVYFCAFYGAISFRGVLLDSLLRMHDPFGRFLTSHHGMGILSGFLGLAAIEVVAPYLSRAFKVGTPRAGARRVQLPPAP